MTNNTTFLEEKEKRNIALRKLISWAPTVQDADRAVQKFSNILGEDTLENLRAKYEYVKNIYNYNDFSRSYDGIDKLSEFDQEATKYYSFLSVLILKKWD